MGLHMVAFPDLRIVPEVQQQMDRGVGQIRVIISAAEKHTAAEVERLLRLQPEIDPNSVQSSEHFVFATLTPQQISTLSEHPEVRKIWPNKEVQLMMQSSARTIGARAVWEDFGIRGSGIVWAVLDSGIDSTHEALRDTVIDQINLTSEPGPGGHGTHVAGIIAGHCEERDFFGVAPECKLYDFKVAGAATFDISLTILALDRIRKLNQEAGKIVIHGANISLGVSNEENLKQFQCGFSPVCEEANRLAESGVVVCVAAGNYGAQAFLTPGKNGPEIFAGFITMGIIDPGNADLAITVGSTHKEEPRRYGISPFSSKGPTGDGRCKPDLVAPGEKVRSCVPGNQYQTLSGTSQATPHVSGAAALLLSACPGLIGNPRKVKEILLSSCQDLGRDHHFQGAGLVYARRAVEEVKKFSACQ